MGRGETKMTQNTAALYTEENKTSDAIKADIAQTRNRLGQKIDVLQERLDPSRIKTQIQDSVEDVVAEGTTAVVDYFRSNLGNVTFTLVDAVKRNPMPTALIGIGIGWMLVRGANQSGNSGATGSSPTQYQVPKGGNGNYGGHSPATYKTSASPQPNLAQGATSTGQTIQIVKDTASDLVGQVVGSTEQLGDQVQEFAQQAGEHVQSTIGHVQEQTTQLNKQMQQGLQNMGNQLQTTLDNNPIALGVATLIGGLLIGLALPETATENQLLGKSRDQLLDNTQDVATSLKQQVQEVVDEKTPAIKKALQDASNNLVETGKKVVDDLATTSKSTVQDIQKTLQEASKDTPPAKNSL
jgi:gas vesicle protein